MASLDPKLYELSFLIKAETPEEADISVNKMRKYLEDQSTIITDASRPEKKRLSYPIKKQAEAYFGSIKFLSKEELESGLKDFSSREAGIIRIMLVKAEKAEEAPKRREIKIERKETPAEEVASEEAIDKKLEEILGA